MKSFKLSLDWLVRIAAGCAAMFAYGQTEPARPFNDGEFLPYPGVPKEFRVRGIVMDSASKQGIAAFRITTGKVDPETHRIVWLPFRIDGREGTFSTVLPRQGLHVLRAEAEGYEPSVSESFSADRAPESIDFVLKKGSGFQGVIQLPGGRPAAAATVIFASEENIAYMELQKQFRLDGIEHTTTDERGRFVPPRVENSAFAFVSHEEGFAGVPVKELEESRPVVLQRWSRVEGTLSLGGKPAADKAIVLTHFMPRLSPIRESRHFYVWLRTRTDAGGRFVFESVPPGELRVHYHAQPLPSNAVGTIHLSHGIPVNARPGETARPKLGGGGRAVTGRVSATGRAATVDWKGLDVQMLRLRLPDSIESAHERELKYREYVLEFQPDGSFRVEDVPAGEYALDLETGRFPLRQEPLPYSGRVRKRVIIPEAPTERRDEPFDLGVIEFPLTEPVGRTFPMPGRR